LGQTVNAVLATVLVVDKPSMGIWRVWPAMKMVDAPSGAVTVELPSIAEAGVGLSLVKAVAVASDWSSSGSMLTESGQTPPTTVVSAVAVTEQPVIVSALVVTRMVL
jgi:hypothetical protein